MHPFARLFAGFIVCLVLPRTAAAAAPALITPGAQWRDTQGHVIEAHGGGILQVGRTWYWFGEDRNPNLDPDKRYVSCYSSPDLVHWKSRGYALALSDPEHLGPHWVLERPKVYYSPAAHQFVMYMHLDDARYKYARVAVARSSRVTGPYVFLRSFRPLESESRDIGQFVDDDGQAYLIFESRPSGGFYVARLSPDRLSVESPAVAFLHIPLEGGALFHYQGMYYVLGSHLTGWSPNSNVYAAAPKLTGPWSTFRNIAPASPDTYGVQSTFALKVTGTKQTTVIFLGDIWKPKSLWDSRYLWMPLTITADHQVLLPEPQPWTINVKQGQARIAAPATKRPSVP
jgi:hypothetical protein